MQIRLFAALRDLAGASVVEVEDADTVGELLDTLGERYGERFAAIAAAGSVVVDGDRAERDRPLRDGEEIALLPPVSGGSA
jgi:MoaD family protein